ncbi:Phenylalanyl-tRNA synthetase beta chain [hydrothermal vent metagenome]|uniref:Phenylalanyl-tRNA synthetase beta chain n=1 Tax=hydrothermal vent metagenome TaxID=652676 RepID=A0A1W1DSP3_9ZZZZ
MVDVNLFDVYAGENIESGKKSVALNLSYQSVDQTLSDDQVNAQVSEVLALMQTKFSATQR